MRSRVSCGRQIRQALCAGVLLSLAPSLAQAAACTGMPRWLGFNVNGVLEYCGIDGQIHALALGDTMGAVPGTVAPTPQVFPTPVPTLAPFVYVAPTVVPSPTRVPALTAVYDPASLAAAATRDDVVAVTGIVTGRAVVASPGVTPANGCVVTGVRASATDQVTISWKNVIAATTACNTASSTWTFVQP